MIDNNLDLAGFVITELLKEEIKKGNITSRGTIEACAPSMSLMNIDPNSFSCWYKHRGVEDDVIVVDGTQYYLTDFGYIGKNEKKWDKFEACIRKLN